MDPAATSPEGAHALVSLLRSRGVTVVVADSITQVERAAAPGTLLLVAQTRRIASDSLLSRIAYTSSDLLLVQPTPRARAALAPGIRTNNVDTFDDEPNCALREANQAGSVQFGSSDAYTAAGEVPVISCYHGKLVRYRDGQRTVTVVGGTDFMTNGGLLQEGNAALAMNLTGARSRVIWYAPQHIEGARAPSATIFDLIPNHVIWIVWQLWLVVALVALWKSRRVGPLVAEDLPVVVRASETIEGRGRLYRSRRARDRAAQALRTATLQRLVPWLGIGSDAAATAVVAAISQRTGADSESVQRRLFGPPPATDTELIHLAQALDDIERQVAHS